MDRDRGFVKGAAGSSISEPNDAMSKVSRMRSGLLCKIVCKDNRLSFLEY